MTDLPAIILVGLRLLLAIALYAFLGYALLLLFRDLKLTAQQQLELQPPAISLLIHSQEGKPQKSTFSRPIIIGRDPACDVPVADETVSAHHARVWYENTQWWVQDLGSRNGTFLNEIRLEAPLILAPEDILLCGKARFQIEIDESN